MENRLGTRSPHYRRTTGTRGLPKASEQAPQTLKPKKNTLSKHGRGRGRQKHQVTTGAGNA